MRRLHYSRSATNPTSAAPRRGVWLRRKLEQTSARPGGGRCQRTWPKGRSCIMTKGAASVSGAPMLHGWDNFFIMAGSSAATLIGLLFVAITLAAGISTPRSTLGASAFLTPTLVNFGTVLFQCGRLRHPVVLRAQGFRWGFGMGCGWPRRAAGGHHARQAFRTGEAGRPLALRVGVHIQRSPFGIQVSEKSAPQAPKLNSA